MGFLFVFLPDEDDNNKIITKKKANSNGFSSSSSSSPLSSPSLKRTNSSHLRNTAQSTISICALLVFITLLLFTLSTFEPTTPTHHNFKPRRQLSSTYVNNKNMHENLHALQGMGTLYIRGTRAMSELLVAHVVETLSFDEFRVFIRLLYRSGLTSRYDLLFIYSSRLKSSSFDQVIREENESFLKLIELYSNETNNSRDWTTPPASFDVTQFVKLSKKEGENGEPIWGRKIQSNFSAENATELAKPSYGSVVGFDVDELDPENSLAGFLDHVPMSLRRWACYPMLLGRVKKYFKQIMLVDVKEMLLLGDPLGRVRNRSPETVYLLKTSQSSLSKHGKKNSEKTQSKYVDPTIIIGGARGVRRLSNAMLTEIARAAMQHKRKNSVTELGLFNQLVGNENLLRNVNFMTIAESVAELSSLSDLNSKSGSSSSISKNFTMIKRGNRNTAGVDFIIVNHICSFPH